MKETENQIRLRRAKESLQMARDNQIDCLRAIRDADESVKRCKERYDELFLKVEQEECDRAKLEYRHSTH